MGDNQNPVNIAKAAIEHASKNGFNVVILDTAGRLHVDEGMMEELQQIKETVNVDQTILVVDAMTGQDAVNVSGTLTIRSVSTVSFLRSWMAIPEAVQPSPFGQSPENRFYILVWVKSFLIWSSFTRTAWLPEFLEWEISCL